MFWHRAKMACGPVRLVAHDATMEAIEIVVEGHPTPGGSKTAIPVPNRKWRPGVSKMLRYLHDGEGRPIVNVVDANSKAKAWKRAVAKAAHEQYEGPLIDAPVIVEATFYICRPKGHYGTGRNAKILKTSAPLYPAKSPDLLKLMRPVEDALTAVVWVDDGQTVDMILRERFAPGYCVDGEPGEKVVLRVLPHAYTTVGEVRADRQEQLAVA